MKKGTLSVSELISNVLFSEFIHQIEHVLRPEGGAAVIRALDAVERHILPGLLHLVVEQQTLLKGHQPIPSCRGTSAAAAACAVKPPAHGSSRRSGGGNLIRGFPQHVQPPMSIPSGLSGSTWFCVEGRSQYLRYIRRAVVIHDCAHRRGIRRKARYPAPACRR